MVAGGGIYFKLNQNYIAGEMTVIDNTDYAHYRINADKKNDKKAPGISFSVHTDEELSDNIYETPLGFPIISYSDKWTSEKLVDIYDELIQNAHGSEINYISKVVINPGGSELTAVDTEGTHSRNLEDYFVFFDVPAIVPQTLKYEITSTMSVIELNKMDQYDTAAQAARTIAHEYGHHYTMFYFLNNNEEALASDYYDLRGMDDYDRDVVFDTEEEYYANYSWSIYELAAEDYVQLMGSPNAKKTKNYLDVYDVLVSYNGKEYSSKADATTVNVFPQNNVHVPLADEIGGLAAYYYSYIDGENTHESLDKMDFDISIQKQHKFGYTYYEITWEKPTKDADALYTLVCYDADGNIFMPVRTVNGNKAAIARVGTVARQEGTTIYTCTNSITDADRYFKIYLIWPDGRMSSSELFYADF